MIRIELKSLSDNKDIVTSVSIKKSEINSKLKKLDGYSYNYILILNGEINYIGYSSSLYVRLIQHKYTKVFDELIIIEFKNKKSARETERFLIKTYKPKSNYQYLN